MLTTAGAVAALSLGADAAFGDDDESGTPGVYTRMWTVGAGADPAASDAFDIPRRFVGHVYVRPRAQTADDGAIFMLVTSHIGEVKDGARLGGHGFWTSRLENVPGERSVARLTEVNDGEILVLVYGMVG
jgi:hypothetical protein